MAKTLPKDFKDRIGKVTVTYDQIDHEALTLMDVLNGLLIVEATSNFATKQITYHARCAAFDPVAPYDEIPAYDAEIAVDHTNTITKVTWKRQGHG